MSDNPGVMLLTGPEAAKALAISPRTLWSLTKTGTIPCVRIGRAVRYDPADLRAWIESQKSKAASNEKQPKILDSQSSTAILDCQTSKVPP